MKFDRTLGGHFIRGWQKQFILFYNPQESSILSRTDAIIFTNFAITTESSGEGRDSIYINYKTFRATQLNTLSGECVTMVRTKKEIISPTTIIVCFKLLTKTTFFTSLEALDMKRAKLIIQASMCVMVVTWDELKLKFCAVH